MLLRVAEKLRVCVFFFCVNVSNQNRSRKNGSNNVSLEKFVNSQQNFQVNVSKINRFVKSGMCWKRSFSMCVWIVVNVVVVVIQISAIGWVRLYVCACVVLCVFVTLLYRKKSERTRARSGGVYGSGEVLTRERERKSQSEPGDRQAVI